MSRPICPGSGRAVPGHSVYVKPDAFKNCPACSHRMRLVAGVFPKHRLRVCMAPGCEANQSGAGLCASHNLEIVGVE